jgi:hypothetical protein
MKDFEKTGLAIIVMVMVALGYVLLYPAYKAHVDIDRKSQDQVDIRGVIIATRGYRDKYGHLPLTSAKLADGSSDLNAALISVLFAKSDAENPRQIVYLETRRVKDSKKPRGGYDPNTGLFFDPFGNYYRIALDTDGDGKIENPYDDAGQKMLKADAIVWSLGKDGIQGVKGNPRQFRGSDDVVSWQ